MERVGSEFLSLTDGDVEGCLSSNLFSLTNSFNAICPPGDEVETELGDFATGKALDGLFYKVGEEEKKIRNNPYEWALDIIQKVFGSVFQD